MAFNVARIIRKVRQLGLTRMLTAPLRSLPHFVIIGAMRCGTSSLYYYLSQHPQVTKALTKEPHFLDHMPLPDLLYRAYFPLTRTLGDHAITGEATPRYITSIEYAKRAARIIPSAKFIVLLRDPVRRAYSHFKQALHFTGETLNFETLVTCEIRELEKSSYEAPAYWEASEHMVKRGLYASQIRGWLQYFPRDQFLIIQSEKMFADPQKITAAVCEFLGLAPEPTQTFSYGARGTSHSRGIDVPKMSPEIQDVLYRFYRPHNEELFTLIGETYDWAIDDGL